MTTQFKYNLWNENWEWVHNNIDIYDKFNSMTFIQFLDSSLLSKMQNVGKNKQGKVTKGTWIYTQKEQMATNLDLEQLQKEL